MRPETPAVAPKVAPDWEGWGAIGEVAFALLPHGHYVYVAWGSDERPLYVGKSSNFLARAGTHSRESAWYRDTLRFELHAFDTAAAAEDAELEAIAALNPIHNRVRRMPLREREELDQRWAEIQAKKEQARIARQQAKAESHARWLARKAARPKPTPRVRPEPVPSPWPRRRRRKAVDVYDVASARQLAIIRHVQNRGAA